MIASASGFLVIGELYDISGSQTEYEHRREQIRLERKKTCQQVCRHG